MNIDQDQTTQTDDQATTTTTTPDDQQSQNSQDQSSVTTTDDNEPIDLGSGDDDEQKTDDGDKDGGDQASAFLGAPAEDEAYVIEGLPEGMTIDEAALEAVTPAFRELNLSSAGASKVAAVYAEKVLPHVVEQTTKKLNDDLQQRVLDQRNEWEGEARALVKGNGVIKDEQLKTGTGDPITFDGADIKQVLQVSARAIDRVMPAGFRKFLDETGLGKHPAMIAGMYKVGKLVGEDSDFEGGGEAPKPKSREEKYYGAQ